MTRNGLYTSRLAFYRRRSDRVSLLNCRSCGSVGLYRSDDVVGARADRDQTNRAGSQHSRCVHRCVPILARRPFCVEIVLAIRATFNSGRLSRRILATIRFRPESFDWAGAAFLRCTFDLSPQ